MFRLVVMSLAATVATLALAQPALAAHPCSHCQLLPGSHTTAGTVDGITGSSATGYSTDGSSWTTIHLTSPRTIIDFDALSVSPGHLLRFELQSATDIVLVRLDGSAMINGTLQGAVGTSGPVGGNVWLSAAGGVAYGPYSVVDAGGVVTATGDVPNDEFLDAGATTFPFTGGTGEIVTQPGAQITGHGGVTAFLAPSITHASGADVEATTSTLGTRADTEIVYAAAGSYELRLTPDLANGFDLLRLRVPTAAATGSGVDLYGTTSAGDVFAASRSPQPLFARNLSTAYAAGTGGNVVLAAGAGVARTSGTAAPTAPREPGSGAHRVSVAGTVTGTSVLARATGDLEILSGAQASGGTVALATDGALKNPGGVAGVSATTRWAVYAGHPDDITEAGLNSNQRAVWSESLDSRPISEVNGNRYVFEHTPIITFTAVSEELTWGETPTFPMLTPTPPQGAVPGRFLGDTRDEAYTGAPARTSPGTGPDALVDDDENDPSDGPYPITIGQGTLSSSAGYGFELVSDATLTWLPKDGDLPPAIDLDVTGTEGANGWHTSDVGLDWTVTDDEDVHHDDDEPQLTGCTDADVTADTAGAHHPCTAVANGRRVRRSVTVKRDATAPDIVASATSGGAPYTEGQVAAADVQVRFACTDGMSGVAPSALTLPVQTITAEGETPLVPNGGVCADNAGNTARTWFGPVRIQRPRPPAGGGPGAATGDTSGTLPALLRKQAARGLSALRKVGLRGLLRRGYRRTFAAPGAGTVLEEVRKGKVVVARGTKRVTGAGAAKLVVRPTKAGRRALRGRRSAKLVVRSAFTTAAPGARPVAATRSAVVRRGG